MLDGPNVPAWRIQIAKRNDDRNLTDISGRAHKKRSPAFCATPRDDDLLIWPGNSSAGQGEYCCSYTHSSEPR
jgi:hypothetical protein